jgi:Zn-dependent protease
MFSSITNTIQNFRADPGGTLLTLLYVAVCILFSLIIHECAHGYMALKCGDPTAKWMGRLTLDPRKHLDPLGTICMVFLHVGWAKPVPINPNNFKNYRRDYILVSLAGIAVNLLMCLLSLLISALLSKAIWQQDLISSLAASGKKTFMLNVYENSLATSVYAGMFDLFRDYARTPWLMYVQRLFLMLAQMNLGLALFNLLPIPPLDGFRFLDQFVFKGRLNMNPQTMWIIQIVFLFVCFSGLLSGLMTTVNSFVMGVFSSIFAVII